MHGSGAIQVQTKVAAHPHSALPGRDHQTQVADQHFPDTAIADSQHSILQSGQLPIMGDPGQHSADPLLAGQLGAPLQILRQQMQRNIQYRGGHFQKSSGDLLPACYLHSQTGSCTHTGVMRKLLGAAQRRCIMSCPLGCQQIQNIPPQGIDGRRGQGQTGGDIRPDIYT